MGGGKVVGAVWDFGERIWMGGRGVVVGGADWGWGGRGELVGGLALRRRGRGREEVGLVILVLVLVLVVEEEEGVVVVVCFLRDEGRTAERAAVRRRVVTGIVAFGWFRRLRCGGDAAAIASTRAEVVAGGDKVGL